MATSKKKKSATTTQPAKRGRPPGKGKPEAQATPPSPYEEYLEKRWQETVGAEPAPGKRRGLPDPKSLSLTFKGDALVAHMMAQLHRAALEDNPEEMAMLASMLRHHRDLHRKGEKSA